MTGVPNRDANKILHRQWIELCNEARVTVGNSATMALKNFGPALDMPHNSDNAVRSSSRDNP